MVPLALLGAAGGLIVWPDRKAPEAPRPEVSTPAAPGPSPAEARRQARECAQRQLAWAEQQCQRLAAEQIATVATFFHEVEEGIPSFVEEALGLKSKWLFLADRLPLTPKGQHEAFLREAFAWHLFTPGQLVHVVQQRMNNLQDGVAGIENEMLVRLRADLQDLQLAAPGVTVDEPALKQAYAEALARLQHEAQPVVRADVTADLASLVLSDALAVMAARLATSGGIMGGGMAGSWASFGATVVAAILVDQLLSWVWDRFADPRGRLENTLHARLAALRRTLVDGDGHVPGLRLRLGQWLEQRGQARREAVLRLLDAPGGEP
jgi:hypothetical protein